MNYSNEKNQTLENEIIDEKEIKFQKFKKTLSQTNIKLNDYTNWNKIKDNLQRWKCNTLNFFISINEKEFLSKFENFFDKDKSAFEILPILVAQRELNFKFLINENVETLNINDKNNVLNFLRISGLLQNVFLNPDCKDIYSYCFGIEVGLGSNAHKNKSGKWSSEIFEQILLDRKIKFYKEIDSKEIFNWNLLIDKKFDKLKDKRFDFVFKYNEIIYLTELNYFNGGGSKINSESKRFIDLNNIFDELIKKAKDLDAIQFNKQIFGDLKYLKNTNIQFLYITDGQGWVKTQNKLKEIVEKINNCYNFYLFKNDFFK